MNGWAKTLAVGLGILGGLGACGFGGDPLYDRVPGGERDDTTLDTLGIICETTLTVNGTLEPTTPRPEGINGCWDVGRWMITDVQVDVNGCDPVPVVVDDFIYEVRRDDEDLSETDIIYEDDPQNDRMNLKITSSGDGLCHGSFTHYYTDRTVLELQPTLNADNTLSGIGTFSYHQEDPF